MKKFFITLLGFALLPMLFACKSSDEKNSENKNEEAEAEISTDYFRLLAIVKNVGEKLEVEVIESDYAFGEYWVITPDDIPYTDKDGAAVSRADLKPGDKIEITYSGQVMMSYPPQIVAKAIKLR